MSYEKHILNYERPVAVLDVARELARRNGIPEFRIYSDFKDNGIVITHAHCGVCITPRPVAEAIYFTLEYCPENIDCDPRFFEVKELKVSGLMINERFVKETLDALKGN